MINLDQNKELSYPQQHQVYGQEPSDVKQMQCAMAYLLMDLCEEGDNDANNVQELESFNSPKVPSISIYDYICRIVKQAQCSQECLIMGLILIDKLSQKWGRIVLKTKNVHRLYVVAVMLSAKFFDDRFFQNSYYSKVAGITHEEFNHLERELVFILDFKLLIDPELFFTYRQRIITNYFDDKQ